MSSGPAKKSLQFYCCAALLCLTAAGYHLVRPEGGAISPARPLGELSMTLGNWQGTEAPLGTDAVSKIVKLTGSEDHLNRVYSAGPGRRATLYVSFHGTPDVFRPHSPRWCYQATGWTLLDEQVVDVKSGTETIPATQLLFERNAEQKAVQYWYIDTGRLARSCKYSRLEYLLDSERRRRRYIFQVHVAAPVLTSPKRAMENCDMLSAVALPELRKHLPEAATTKEDGG